MKRMIIVARLREGTTQEAEDLLEQGPPFDPEELGLQSHSAYLTSGEIVFVFEAPGVEWIVNGATGLGTRGSSESGWVLRSLRRATRVRARSARAPPWSRAGASA